MRCYVLVVLVLLVAAAVRAERDYYEVLGLQRDATEKQIKSAYRALSKKFHPDKNPGDEVVHERFIEVGEAYEVLNDRQLREKYDRFGHAGVKGDGAGQQGSGFDPFGGFNPFGGFGTHFQHGQRRRGHNADVQVQITLQDFYTGSDFSFSVEMQNLCSECSGTGSQDGEKHTCGECGGRGQKIVERQIHPGMRQRFQTTCDVCGGRGKVIAHKCARCHGHGVFRGARDFEFFVEPGTPRDAVHKMEGQADQSPDWEAGDLVIHIHERDDANLGFRRRMHDLYRTEPLTLKESVLGNWSREIETLDRDANVTLARAAGEMVYDGQIERIPGRGMPVLDGPHEYGDLFIEYRVIYPLGASNYKLGLRDEL